MLMRFLFLFLVSCFLFSMAKAQQLPHVFYLHGKIVEEQGPRAISKDYGPYLYAAIIDSLQATPAIIHHELRTTETGFEAFADKTAHQIDSLIDSGIPAALITVVGASKGAVMAMYISDKLRHPVNYVFLGANNTYIEEHFDWQLHGHILAIYEQTDTLAGKPYDYWKARSPEAIHFQQLQLHTGLGHGFLYRPLEAWLTPGRQWIRQNYRPIHH